MDLLDIKAAYEATDVPVTYQDGTDEYPIPHLVATVDEDEGIEVQLAFIEVGEPWTETRLLQIFVPLPIEVHEEAVPEVRGILTRVNRDLPLMAFNLEEDERFLYYRHVLMLPAESTDTDFDVVNNAIGMSLFLIEEFRPVLDEIASGDATAAQAVAEANAHSD